MDYYLREIKALLETKYSHDPNNSNYVYKSCEIVWIVVLKKLPDTITNESREVADANHAKFRADKLLVVDIINKFDTSKKIDAVRSSKYQKAYINYKIGEIASVDDFETNLSAVCAKGLHYFKSIESAFYYELDGIYRYFYTGYHCSWHENGNKHKEGNYVDGFAQSIWTYWHHTGNKSSEGNYSDGFKHGKWTFWHENGDEKCKNDFVHGYEEGY